MTGAAGDGSAGAHAAGPRGAAGLRIRVRRLYDGHGRQSRRFHLGLILFDLATLVFIAASSFHHDAAWVQVTGVVVGLAILVELSARVWSARRPAAEAVHPLSITDMIAVVSLLAPLAGLNLAFVRALRALRILRSYRVVVTLTRDIPFLRRNADTVYALTHLVVFVFVMTALVYESQSRRNPDISNYADALYFTITALTTTGFGDITLEGEGGRLLSVLIMVLGVSLFVRLLQTLFRPTKVHHECPNCGLTRHDLDAVHCKHCGIVLHIPDEGLD